jgi:hypothetical protein
MTESALIGSVESSEGSNLVKDKGSPSSQLAKSVEKFSAKNLQVLSNIARFNHCLNSAAICARNSRVSSLEGLYTFGGRMVIYVRKPLKFSK